jgi:hypothetical protein
VIGNKLEWYSNERYDMVKEKACCGVSDIVEGGHSFSPFCEVIDCDNNVFVSSAGGGITSHEVDAPFTKGAGSDDWMKKSRWCSGFVGIKLTLPASFHGMNAIMKQSRPKVTFLDNPLSSGYSQKMAPTCVIVAIVQDSISLVNGQELTKNGVDPSSV